MLTDGQLTQVDLFGFLVLKGLLTPEETDRAGQKDASQKAAVRSMVVGEARLASKFPHLARHPHWVADSEGDPVRGRRLETLRKWGFIQ